MNAAAPVFAPGTPRVISAFAQVLRDVGSPATPPRAQLPAPTRRPQVPEPVIRLLRDEHANHLRLALENDNPSTSRVFSVRCVSAREWHMGKAAVIRRAIADAGDTEEAVTLSAAETGTRRDFMMSR